MTPGPWLERATELDAPALAALEKLCHSHPWSEGQFRQEVRHPSPNATLVLREAGAAGTGRWRGIRAYAVYRLVADEMHILNVAVAPRWRRKGLARWLLRFSLAAAARAGARQALLEARRGNHAARLLYEAMGFVEVGTRTGYYAEPREDAVVFSRPCLVTPQP